MPGPSLVLEGLSCHIGTNRVLSGISLALPPGARCVVAGPSGAGKTTLLRLLAGLQPAQDGRLWLDGTDLTRHPPESRPFGWVGAEPGLLPQLDALGQVELPLRLAGTDAGKRRRLALAALESVGLGHRIESWPHQLSSGEALRVAMARAAVTLPRCLLMDEPFARMDPVHRVSLRKWISQLQATTRCTVIETSHWLPEAIHGATHVAILRRGRLVQFGEASSVWTKPSTPWTLDFLSTLPNWWSAYPRRDAHGWWSENGMNPPERRLLAVRLDLASWVSTPPEARGLGPLKVQQVHPWGSSPRVEAWFPDGQTRSVPLRVEGLTPRMGDSGWARFGPEAVVGFDTDDRETP